MPVDRKRQLLEWVHAGINAVQPAHCLVNALQRVPREPTAVVAIGKAAFGMASASVDVLRENAAFVFVAGPSSPPMAMPGAWQYVAGDHPVPGAASINAGRRLSTFLLTLDDGLPLLVLLSGGGSAMVELPVEGATVKDVRDLNRWLLASGMNIHGINTIRARFSLLKRGGMLRIAGQRRVTGLVISDVPGDHVADVASGPLSPEPVRWPASGLPPWVQSLHARCAMPPSSPPEAVADLHVVARNDDVLNAIERQLRSSDLNIVVRESLRGDAAVAGVDIAERLRTGERGVYLFGGETSVTLQEVHGRGGRNQHLALAAAQVLAGVNNCALLAVGTDGIDGNTSDAGALVDGETVARIRDAGLDPQHCLETRDSNTALAAAEDLINTGVTGTNVADIVIAWKW